MPTGYHDGQPITPPGRPNKNRVKKGPFYFDQDVLDILAKLPKGTTMTEFIQEAIRKANPNRKPT